MDLKIGHKLAIAFSIILITFFINILININIIQKNKNGITNVRELTYKQVEYSTHINESIIQVQQFLSDASATKNTDGFNEADKYKKEFKDSIKKLEEVNPKMKDRIENINSDFDKFYELGVNMTHTYIDKGYEQGNILMEQFDPMAVKLSDETKQLSDDSKNSMDIELKNIDNRMNNSLIISLALGAVSLVVSIFIILRLTKGITKPINSMLVILKDLEMGEGDLRERISIKSRDEIGIMAHSFNNFMDKLSQMIGNIKNNSVTVANSSKTLNKSSIKIEDRAMEINNSVANVKNDIESIASSVEEVTATVDNIAQASYNTAEDTQEISSMSEQINDIAFQSGKVALEAKMEMDKIKKISSNTVELNKNLGIKAKEIERIVDTIKQITDQTNLLALNASIEAARAGENGKGFSVVAEEIRKLADNNINSTKVISEIVSSIQEIINDTISSTMDVVENIKQGDIMVGDVYNQLQDIINGIQNINNRIENMASASQEQSASIEELSTNMESINDSNSQISLVIDKISNSIEIQTETISESSEMSSKLNSLAEELNNLVNKFKTA